MTQADLICEKPYMIGFVGSFSFIAFAIGSVLFTKQADRYGRKKIVVFASLITPIGICLLLGGVRHLGIYFIFAIMTCMALAYNPRSSTAFLYASEIIPPSKRILFSTFNFTLDGIFSISAACYFYYIGD